MCQFRVEDLIIIIAGCLVVLIVSVLKEKNIQIRESLAKKPIVIRWAVYYAIFISIIIWGYISDGGGFMYAAF